MKIINLDKWTGTYAEIPQNNPLRWMNLRRVEDKPDTYEPVSMWWKCKDFMNEVVTAGFTGKTYKIYGFECDPAKFFDSSKTITWLLKHVGNAFEHNIKVVNAFLVKQKFPELTYEKYENMYVVFLPKKYQENTMFMSQVTLFIRLASCDKECATLEEMLAQPVNSGDRQNFEKCLEKPLGKFPKSLSDFIWYWSDEVFFSKKDLSKTFSTSHMHNCGVVNWGWC